MGRGPNLVANMSPRNHPQLKQYKTATARSGLLARKTQEIQKGVAFQKTNLLELPHSTCVLMSGATPHTKESMEELRLCEETLPDLPDIGGRNPGACFECVLDTWRLLKDLN
jgi:hypothetical protein